MPAADTKFQADNLVLAREFHALSRKQLADATAVSDGFLGLVERGIKRPSGLLIAAFAEVLGVQPRFFFERFTHLLQDSECSFRRRDYTPVALRRRGLAHGTFFARLVVYLDDVLALPVCDVPTISAASGADIERAAESCRMRWGLGRDLPIVNMMRVLENHGVAVSRMSPGNERLSAFSSTAMPRPLVILNADKRSGCDARFDCARELGHLVLHGRQQAGTKAAEVEADRFAIAFLLPRAGIGREFPRSTVPDWPRILKLKQRWRVSMQKTVRRAYDLGLVSAVTYRRAYRHMSEQGWHKREPGDFAAEEPELMSAAFDRLEQENTPATDVARELGWTTELLERVAQIDVKRPAPTAGILLSLKRRAAAGTP